MTKAHNKHDKAHNNEHSKHSHSGECCSCHGHDHEEEELSSMEECIEEVSCCSRAAKEAEEPSKAGDDIKKELEDFKGKYFRALAEIENTRKRLQKEKAESQSFAIQSLIFDFLSPLDHFEHALKHSQNASAEIKNWVIGFQMILDQLQQVLKDNDVSSFESKGQQFNPHYHEAIETEETTNYPDGTVIEEFSRGYTLGSRVIRPAKVKVAVSVSEKKEQQENS